MSEVTINVQQKRNRKISRNPPFKADFLELARVSVLSSENSYRFLCSFIGFSYFDYTHTKNKMYQLEIVGLTVTLQAQNDTEIGVFFFFSSMFRE